MTTSKQWKINMDTMHQCVVGFAAPKKTIRMLEDKLDGGATPMHQDAIEARVHFSKMSPWTACKPS